ncbi:phage tail protein [Paenibacillus whitsoniae]|uniref:Phage tail protein n=1 Tax=Paenibacillus whitsoniae TaxID=2496558 RepID=A0A430JC08_9BACL|nr:tail fiber protein [Paenibacillus whitsoniae]RTE08537.1 phage tail protein [Paenibacillus whitsoniae]
MDPYLGEIRIFAGNYAPSGWAFCDGTILPVSQNSALYSIIGGLYGGNGTTTFALPNFQGSAPVHQGTGPGLTPRTVGEVGGETDVMLLETQIPNHTHSINAQLAPTQIEPTGAVWSSSATAFGQLIYSPLVDTPMSPLALSVTGSNNSHNNMQPFVAMNFIISLEGNYPPKPSN